ncbi:MAG: cysteine synthase family protein [candidate division Zixibacteria bacterium]|nr:cysteine synthase family protein [candidate division Zixibacteria bacterium]
MKTYDNILELVGRTPLVRLRTGIPENGPEVYAKLDFLNPTGSVKDRMALHIIRKAMDEGRLKPGDTVVDNTSGNTGASMAMVCQVLGLKAVVTTPVKTSKEKTDLIRSFGAEVIVTPETMHDDPKGFYMVARRLAKENGWFDLNQYNSPENIEAHYLTTGPEIWEDTDGRITHFVCGIGTGGTFSGAARFLKEKNPNIRAVAVDPEGSIFADLINEGRITEAKPYKVEGIGTDVPTDAMLPELVDEVITVSDRDSFLRAREVTRREGISAGGSSGSVAWAMEQVAREAAPEALIVGIFADGGIKYLSKCFNDDWMTQHGFLPDSEVGS